ncbi:MAG: 7TM diverse intracellular signaling domain-containing protein [Leptospira sp.]|nr:7TM diverse intracellular signaling domain-containing protein [Leptospira sp.]
MIDKEQIYSFKDFNSESNKSIPLREIPKNSLSLGFVNEPVWIRLDAKNISSSTKIILDLGNSHLDEVNVYEKGNPNPIKIGGDFLAHSQWDAYSKSVAFQFEWPLNEDKTFYLETKTSSNISYTIRFYTAETFYLKENIENMILGFFYGTIFIMVLYNLFIYFILKDSAYILYSFSIFFNLALQVYLNGILNQILTLNHPDLHNRIGSVILCFSACFGWLFAQQTLNLRERNRYANRTIYVLIGMTVCYLLFFIYNLPLNLVVRTSNFIAQVFVISVFIVALLNYGTGNKQAKLFLLGWSTLLLGILLFTLMQNGFLPANLVTIYSNQIGSTLEAGILSLALANKINQLKEEKAKAQSEALLLLEEKVRERTKNLDESLFNIRKDLSVAKKIQQTFFSEIRTSDPRIKFDSFYQSMSEVGGDFYDMTQVNPDHYRIFVADATGHGIQAALITMAIKAEYESLKVMYDHPNDLIFHLNQIFINKYNNVQTIFSCAVCDIDLSKGKLMFASAGHPDQLHIRVGEKKLLPRTGKIVGMIDHAEYRSLEYYVEEGDRIYLFTDGVFEQFNSEREIFGEQKVYEILSDCDKLSLHQSIQVLLNKLSVFTKLNTHQDDITIVGCEIGRF